LACYANSRLDLSFNVIRKLENLDTLTNLRELYVISNKIGVIQGTPAAHRCELPSCPNALLATHRRGLVQRRVGQADQAEDAGARIQPHSRA